MFSGPIFELHISNVHRREEIYHHSRVSRVATAVLMGLGADGYPIAVAAMVRLLAKWVSRTRVGRFTAVGVRLGRLGRGVRAASARSPARSDESAFLGRFGLSGTEFEAATTREARGEDRQR